MNMRRNILYKYMMFITEGFCEGKSGKDAVVRSSDRASDRA